MSRDTRPGIEFKLSRKRTDVTLTQAQKSHVRLYLHRVLGQQVQPLRHGVVTDPLVVAQRVDAEARLLGAWLGEKVPLLLGIVTPGVRSRSSRRWLRRRDRRYP